MVVLNNDYIFLPKTKKDDYRISSKGTDDTIRIQARKNILLYIRNIFGEPICKDKENIVFKVIYTYEKYSLQGTTQGNGLAGADMPVRFSM